MEDMKLFGVYGLNIGALAFSFAEINPAIQFLVLIATLTFTVIQIIKALKVMAQIDIDGDGKGDIQVDIKTLVGIAMGLFSIAGVYFTLMSQIQALEVSVMRMEAEQKMNSEFRIKWPRGEMGSLPDDAEQNLRLIYLEKTIEKHNFEVDDLKLKVKSLEDCE